MPQRCCLSPEFFQGKGPAAHGEIHTTYRFRCRFFTHMGGAFLLGWTPSFAPPLDGVASVRVRASGRPTYPCLKHVWNQRIRWRVRCHGRPAFRVLCLPLWAYFSGCQPLPCCLTGYTCGGISAIISCAVRLRADA